MHIILSVLGVIVTILILLNRLNASGVDIGWLNPFAWKRRREWAKKYHANPIYSLDSPMEITALIMVALAKSEGEISTEQKQEILNKYQQVFHLSESAAVDLFSSIVFILKEDISAIRNTQKLLDPSGEKFSPEQASSSISLFKHISILEGPENTFQREVINEFEGYFRSKFKAANEWV
ncbi:MAG: hypothetical protein KZQ93_06975 [Candidatus Thiodiazotropha sp. (ex Monitilora ramsayi)]|nr:hypothetical protein [Candidatus Thiodiazotropha sp. (ex Monitilora ramsayi)]